MNLSIIVSILLFFGILVFVNIPAPFLGLEFEDDNQPRLWFQPPGYVIAIVWFFLFTLMGVARYQLVASGYADCQWLLFTLAILCASYAYYTLGLAKWTGISALWFGLIGNLIVIAYTAVVVFQLYPVSKVAAGLVFPVIAWTCFASLIVIAEMRMEKLI